MATASKTPLITSKSSDSISSLSEHERCGYMIHNIASIINKWKCVYCFYLIKEPIQLTECGHRACRGCFESRAQLAAADEPMTCPNVDCATSFDRSQFMVDRAFKREIDALVVSCYHKEAESCQWTGPLMAYQEHLDTKHTHYVCKHCQKKFSFKQALVDHAATTCPAHFQSCLICGPEPIRKDDFQTHVLSEKHQETITLILTGKYSIKESANAEADMESSAADDENERKIMDTLKQLVDKVHLLTDKTEEISNEFVKLSETSQVAAQEVNNIQLAVNDRNTILHSLQPAQQVQQRKIEELKQLVDDNQHVSTDGTLTWRVDKVAEKMADAQSDRVPSIFSPIFYSAPTGYKMRARLYLHGDGIARRTHMSLFFLLMKGEFDGLLSWPFGYKVTFCLIDQTENKQHIIDSFRPDVKSNSFQRPKTDMNIASGIPRFFPLPMIQQDENAYVREDTLFLRIIVDLDETPKTILPFMLSLNPGLPAHVQQFLINQEKLKRKSMEERIAPMMLSSQSVGVDIS